jgi:iron complex transport system permease protein
MITASAIKSPMYRDWIVNGSLLLLLALMFTISLLAGRVWLPLGEVWHGLWSPDANLAATIITQLRLPRAILALEVGAALGLSGAVLQGVTRNPLAEPGLLGVSAGAALGAVIAVYFGLATRVTTAAPLLGLIGALLASTRVIVPPPRPGSPWPSTLPPTRTPRTKS